MLLSLESILRLLTQQIPDATLLAGRWETHRHAGCLCSQKVQWVSLVEVRRLVLRKSAMAERLCWEPTRRKVGMRWTQEVVRCSD